MFKNYTTEELNILNEYFEIETDENGKLYIKSQKNKFEKLVKIATIFVHIIAVGSISDSDTYSADEMLKYLFKLHKLPMHECEDK